MENDVTVFCKECIYAKLYYQGGHCERTTLACEHPENIKTNLVTGEQFAKFNCERVRSETDKYRNAFCGPEGKAFVQKLIQEPAVKLSWISKFLKRI